MERIRILFILLAVLACITAADREWGFAEQGKKSQSVSDRVPGRWAAVAKGMVASRDESEISSKVVGLIQEITAEENEGVKKGQTLVILDSKEVEAQIREAEASRMKAQANQEKSRINYERYERLYKNGAVTLNEVEDFRRQFKLAEGEILEINARIDYLKKVLQNYVLRSPIDGIITKKHHEVGETAREGMIILSVASTNKLKIRAELDETDVGKVKTGQAVEVLTDAYPNRIYKGRVEKILENVKRKSVRTFDPTAWTDINTQEITVSLDSYEGLKIGMTVDIRFHSAGGK